MAKLMPVMASPSSDRRAMAVLMPTM